MSTCLALLLALTPSPSVARTAPAPRAELEIVVTRHADDDGWTATYSLAAPTARLVFPNNRVLFRHQRWEVATDGVELVAQDGTEVVRSTDGAPFDTVHFRIPHQPEHLDRNYEFHVPFTDGGVLLYTGHFVVDADTGPLATEITLHGREGEHILVNGAAHESVTLRHTAQDYETYAYFGRATPIETDEVVALVDPGLPEWVREHNAEYLPRLFELYTERLDLELAAKPMVFFSYLEGTPGKASFSGGALPGLIQLTVVGRDWEAPDQGDEGAFARLIGFLGHESVHLWNMPIGRTPPKPGSAWMHEGGADALSFRALAELGVIDRAGLFMRHERAINQAAKRLVGTSVRESDTPERSMNFYEAGSALALATELAIQETNPDLDLFDFWRTLLAESHASGESYTEEAYYALADRMAPGSDIGARLAAFVETRHEDPAAAFMDLFAPFASVRIELDWETGELSLAPADGGR